MSKKHFIELADMIRRAKGTPAEFNEDQLSRLASFCSSQNYNFKRDRWMDYIAGECGPNGGKVKELAA